MQATQLSCLFYSVLSVILAKIRLRMKQIKFLLTKLHLAIPNNLIEKPMFDHKCSFVIESNILLYHFDQT